MRDFGSALSRVRRDRGVTQAQAAAGVSVSRATLAQWETGRHLPSTVRARRIDELLGAHGELYELAERARSPLRSRLAEAGLPSAPTGGTRTVLQVFRQVGDALVGYLSRDEHGVPLGWRHNLQQRDRPPTAGSTAYGIKILQLLGGPHVDFGALQRSIERFQLTADDGSVGWAGRSQYAPRPEITAVVLDALVRLGAPIEADGALSMLRSVVDDVTRRRLFVLTTVLETVLRIAPASALAVELLECLLAARRPFDGRLLWPEKVVEEQVKLSPSVAHTARAVVVLQAAVRSTGRTDLRDALQVGQDWLAEGVDENGVSEVIGRELEDDERPGGLREELGVRHFTAAWVVRALSGVEEPDVGRLCAALEVVWGRYDTDCGLWAWDNGDLPAWMTYDGVAAVQAAALVLAPSPVPAASPLPDPTEDTTDDDTPTGEPGP